MINFPKKINATYFPTVFFPLNNIANKKFYLHYNFRVQNFKLGLGKDDYKIFYIL